MPRLLLIFLVALLAGCNRQPSATVFVDPALATLVPAETVLLAGIRMQKLVETPLWRDYVLKGRVGLVEDFRKRTGLNPEKDFWEFLIASDAKDAVVLVRGKFADMGMEPKLQREGVERFSYKGFTLVGDEKNAVLFLNPSTAAAGSVPTLRRLVDNRNNISGLPSDLEQRIKKIPSVNQVWFASKVGGVLPALSNNTPGMLTNLSRLAQSVEYASGGFDFRQQVQGAIDMEAHSGQEADRVGGAIRALLGLGRLNTGDRQREILSVYDGLTVERRDTLVRFSANVPYSVLEKAAAELPFLGLR